MKHIAVLDHDSDGLESLAAIFRGANYAVSGYSSGGKFLDALPDKRPDILVLDLNLPSIRGWDLVKMLRANPETRRMLVIVCAEADRSSEDVVKAFDAGADEYFTKPFDKDIFLARIAALVRRNDYPRQEAEAPFEQLRFGELTVDITEHVVRVGDKHAELTALEFDLLVYFVRNRDRVVTRELLLENVWKTDPSQETRTVDKRVSQLRRKLGRFGRRIHTVSGVGYCLKG